MLKLKHSHFSLEAGIDEAGRGSLAGPVFAACVILPDHYSNENLNDSKKINEKNRLLLRSEIIQCAVAYGIGFKEPEIIDKVNILNASVLAMHTAIENLTVVPEFLLIDGNSFKPYKEIPYQCVVKGDATYQSIAAASILAKTARDDYMIRIHEEYPQYEWNKNKGYPTKKHIEAILRYGQTPYHRKSFHTKNQLCFPF